jgi:hypothetical protein
VAKEGRQRLGFETQRHWSERAISRAVSALLGCSLIVTLFAHQQETWISNAARRADWYEKAHPTVFSDALALVRGELRAYLTFCGSPQEADTVKG